MAQRMVIAAILTISCLDVAPNFFAETEAGSTIRIADHDRGITAMRAEIYQFEAPAKDVSGKDIAAFLWIPPEAGRIRGVLVGGQTLMEQSFAADPAIRAACADEQLAIVYFSPPLDALFDYREKNSGALLQKALEDLAEVSGYRELPFAPLFPFGHSVSSIFASHVVCWNPSRCFGALAFKGGLSISANDPNATLEGVPILAIKGQYEEFGPGPSGVLRDFEDRETAWKGMRDRIIRLRGNNERRLIAYLVESGASHFAWSQRLAPYAAEFIRQAARARIPDWPLDAKQPVKCREITPTSGALTSVNLGRENSAARYSDFKGDHAKTFWHLSLELAKMADALHAGLTGKKAQFVTFADIRNGKPIFVGHDLRLKMNPQWIGSDTFKVAGAFLNQAPDKYPKVESPAGHADSSIRFRAFGGTVEQVSSDTFRVALNGRRKAGAEILAFNPGDETYRYAEQQGRVNLPERLTQGRAQSIIFPTIVPLKVGGAPVKLRATSNAGLPVRYFVRSGPAEIEGDKLKISKVPARAKFPMRIIIVAYQYGSAVEPLVQSAESVEKITVLER